jgi:hypothetical protein
MNLGCKTTKKGAGPANMAMKSFIYLMPVFLILCSVVYVGIDMAMQGFGHDVNDLPLNNKPKVILAKKRTHLNFN